MQRHARRNEDLEIPVDWGRRLAALRASAGVDDPAELDVDRVRDVEATIGARIPDPVLALTAAGVPWLADAIGLSLGRFPDHTARAREARAPGDFVGVAASPDGRRIYGFRPGRGDDRIDVFDADRRETNARSIDLWLEEMIEAHGGGRSDPADATPLRARLVRAVLPEGPGERVRHRAWGEGKVLAEDGDGPTRKVKVDFPGQGLKVVQARFLEFLDR